MMTSFLSDSSLLWTALSVVAFAVFLIALAIGTVLVFRAQTAEADFETKSAKMPTLGELQAAESRLTDKKDEIEGLEKRLSDLRQELSEADRHRLDAEHWQNLAEQAERDYRSKDEKLREVDQIRDQYEQAAADLAERRSELEELAAKRDKLSAEVKKLEELEQATEDVQRRIEEKNAELETVRQELQQLDDQREQMYQARFEVQRLEIQKGQLETSLGELVAQKSALEERRNRLSGEVVDLDAKHSELKYLKNEIDRLTERKIALEVEIGKLRGQPGAGGEEEKNAVLQDLIRDPSCLFEGGELLLRRRLEATSEEEALGRVEVYLESLNLQFERRVLNCFHTCLKTGAISPLTVLAGISGTGKSQLPQRYAEAIGIPFLKIAVQPRWDSPQDLLGFYNYLEQRYKATELARALLRMDRHNDFKVKKADDRMLLVLLDEMNLARVEYYFSEFLSRLEGRPGPEETDRATLRSGQIEIDVPLETIANPVIYPGHNVLFVGTMNEDESTQALSDKVLDRANMIRFRRPENLAREPEAGATPIDRYLAFKDWNSWHRTAANMPASSINFIEEFVGRLNKELGDMHRPFGHRVNQAIFSYAANHPNYQTEQGAQTALADMLRMRILPKLRGVELEGRTDKAFRNIRHMIDDLKDEELTASMDEVRSEGSLFNWLG